MAGIDLIGGNAPGIAGQYISNLGEQIINVGKEIGRQYNAQQKSLLDTETAGQVIKAQSLALSTIDEFNKTIDQNTDYQNYGDMWNSQKTGLQDQLSTILKLPSAKQKFDEWWLTAQDKQRDYVYSQTRQKTVASAQAQGIVAIEESAARGDERTIHDTITTMSAAGLFKDSNEAMQLAKEWIPKARYNLVRNHLDKLDDPLAAMDTLNAPDAAGRFQLDPSQVAAMSKDFEGQAAARQKTADARIKKQQSEVFDQFLSDASDPLTAPDHAATTKIMQTMIGSPDFGNVKQYRDAIDADAARITTERIQRGMTANFSQMDTSMLMWNGTGKPPWDPTNVDVALIAEDPALRITEPEANMLKSRYESTMKDIASGSRKGPNFEDPYKVADMLRIVFQDGLSVTEKVVAVNPFFSNGVPPKKWQRYRAMIDEYNGREDWKAAMRPLTAYYNAAIANPANNNEQKMQLALQQSAGSQAMFDLFRKYPNDPSMWERASQSLLDKDAMPKIVNQVRDMLKARFPGFWFFEGKPSEAMQLEVAAEQMPKEFATQPELVAQRTMKADQIKQEEMVILSQQKLPVADAYRDEKSKEWVYSSVPFVRDKNGVVDYKATAAQGTLYRVRSVSRNGRIIQEVQKVGR